MSLSLCYDTNKDDLVSLQVISRPQECAVSTPDQPISVEFSWLLDRHPFVLKFKEEAISLIESIASIAIVYQRLWKSTKSFTEVFITFHLE